jgi:hypothetical protein
MRHKLNVSARSIPARSASLCALLTAACMALGAGASYGRATAGSFEFQEPFSDTVTNYPCSGGAPVTMTGTSTQAGHFTVTDAGHVSVQGTNDSTYRADFPDGRYAVGEETDHFGFSFSLSSPTAVNTNTQQEDATLYAADGQPIATILVRVTHHVTYFDENGNLEPDPGEITTTLARIAVRCPWPPSST